MKYTKRRLNDSARPRGLAAVLPHRPTVVCRCPTNCWILALDARSSCANSTSAGGPLAGPAQRTASLATLGGRVTQAPLSILHY